MRLSKKITSIVLSAVMMLSFVACSNNTSMSYKSGTYTGKANGMKGEVVVDVTFDDTSITKIEIVSHQETPGISDAAFESVPEDIIKYQSLAVDTVAGATISSNAVLEAVAQAVTEAGGDVEALKNVKVEDKEMSNETEELTADVIVIGGGGAGYSAAVSSAEKGLSVIVVEKNSYVGGNTIRSAGAMSIADAETTGKHDMNESQENAINEIINKETNNEDIKELQEICKDQFETFKKENPGKLYDSVEFNALQLFYRFGQVADVDQLVDIVSQSAEAKKWLGDYGFPWTESHVVVGDVWPRWCSSSKHKSGIAFIEVLENAIKENNYDVKVLKSVSGKSLIVDDNGRVTGVTAVGNDGKTYTLNGNKGVVIATGGFAANNEMMTEYSDGRWSNLANISTTNDPSCQGDGILMAKEVGAELVDMGHVQVMPIADPETGYTDTLVGSSTNLYVNKEGKRFVNESADRDTLTNAIMNQTDSSAYIISSKESVAMDADGLNIFGRKVDELIEDGKVLVADTIPELAEKMGVDPAVLEETIAKFNKAVREQNDPEFNRESFTGDLGNVDGTPEIISAPYYACLRKPASHITKGGIKVTNDCNVLNTDGEIIPGLYAAGEVTGGTGIAGIMPAIVQGKLVGETIANQ